MSKAHYGVNSALSVPHEVTTAASAPFSYFHPYLLFRLFVLFNVQTHCVPGCHKHPARGCSDLGYCYSGLDHIIGIPLLLHQTIETTLSVSVAWLLRFGLYHNTWYTSSPVGIHSLTTPQRHGTDANIYTLPVTWLFRFPQYHNTWNE